jgi:hypothetical protein
MVNAYLNLLTELFGGKLQCVLIAMVIFQNGSWVNMNLSCEQLYTVYSELDFLILYAEI